MAKKKETVNRIPKEDIMVGGVYRNAVQDIVKVLKIDEIEQRFILFNVSGAHKQFTDFKHIWLTEKLFQTR